MVILGMHMTKCNEVHPGGKQRDAAVLSSSVFFSSVSVQLFSSVLVELGPVSSMSPASAVVDRRTQFHTGHCLDRTQAAVTQVCWITAGVSCSKVR